MGNHPSLDIFVETLLEARDDLRILVVVDAGHARPPRWPGHPRVVELTVDPGDQAALLSLVDLHNARLGCVMAWPRRLSDGFIAHFAGALFNLHYGDLPRYRGAGGQSWPVLNAETEITAHIQQMHSAMDSGPLLLGETEPLPQAPYPLDVKAAAARASVRSVRRLAQAIAGGHTLPLLEQDEARALYFPRLDTMRNGWIDFAWSAVMIERFIRAFSDPYPGASFRFRGRVYRVRRARLRADAVQLHPFCAGLIVNQTATGIDVATHDGVLHFDDIVDARARPVPSDRFAVGGRCWTSEDDRLGARRFRPGLARVRSRGRDADER